MKHRVTNFGRENLLILVQNGSMTAGHLKPGESEDVGDFHSVRGMVPGQRLHYSVRPAERLPADTSIPVIEGGED